MRNRHVENLVLRTVDKGEGAAIRGFTDTWDRYFSLAGGQIMFGQPHGFLEPWWERGELTPIRVTWKRELTRRGFVRRASVLKPRKA